MLLIKPRKNSMTERVVYPYEPTVK